MTPAYVLYASAVTRVVIALLVAFKLVWRFHRLSTMESLGLALFGGASLLTVPPILLTKTTPYDDWGGLVFGVGLVLYLLGKLIREWEYP